MSKKPISFESDDLTQASIDKVVEAAVSSGEKLSFTPTHVKFPTRASQLAMGQHRKKDD